MKPMGAKRLELYSGCKADVCFVGWIGRVGGNGLLIWDPGIGRLQAERLSRVSAQMAAVLRLQGHVLAFHQRLSELAQSKNASGLKSETEASRDALLEQVQQTEECSHSFVSRHQSRSTITADSGCNSNWSALAAGLNCRPGLL